jgi:hypothetical protein
MSGDKEKQPNSNQHLPPMLVSRADACPSDGEQSRKTSRDVAILCESYCLKNSGQQPENNHAKDHKENGVEHGLVPSESGCTAITSKAWEHRFVGITALSEIGGTC